MICSRCKNGIETDSMYCIFCGNKVLPATDSSQNTNVTQVATTSKISRCQLCGIYAPTRYVEFYQNIGALVRRYSRSIKGDLCKDCINRVFWRFTLTDLTLGWWGMVSVCVTPFYVINNVGRYIMSLGLIFAPAKENQT
jgi:Pyruvate/2-oxoacid:ferredoxin oxidoreductase delta subunit